MTRLLALLLVLLLIALPSCVSPAQVESGQGSTGAAIAVTVADVVTEADAALRTALETIHAQRESAHVSLELPFTTEEIVFLSIQVGQAVSKALLGHRLVS